MARWLHVVRVKGSIVILSELIGVIHTYNNNRNEQHIHNNNGNEPQAHVNYPSYQ